jgi:glutaminase
MASGEIGQQLEGRLEELYRHHLAADAERVTSFYRPGHGYYPADAAGPERDQFAIVVATTDGEVHTAGDHDLRFALQSISKVFAYCVALEDHGREHLLERVGVEPSGDVFYSIALDERSNRPHNPMVNAGALATTTLVHGDGEAEKLSRLLQRFRVYAGNDGLDVDADTFEQEVRTADRNRATAYLMRAQGMLDADVEETLALYSRQCSVMVTCRDLAVMGATLANGGRNPLTGVRALPQARVRDILSVMFTCGMYDYAGEWAYEVGLPAKSGVSGGILCVVPGKAGVGVFSPGLDRYGNSVRGIAVCKELSSRLGLHVFATEAEDAMLGPADPVDGGT